MPLPRNRRTVSAIPSASPTASHQEAEQVEEDERMKVADHVFLAHPPEEALEQQPRDRGTTCGADARALADAVDRARRKVADARVPDVQVDEQVVREPVAACRCGRGRAARGRERDRRVAGLRVGDVPVARRDLRQQRQHRVAEIAVVRDQLPRATGERGGSPWRSRPRRATTGPRSASSSSGSIWLSPAITAVTSIRPRARVVARDDRRSDATVRSCEITSTRGSPTRARPFGRRVARSVVDHEDPVDELRDPASVETISCSSSSRRHDDRDRLAVDHPETVRDPDAQQHPDGAKAVAPGDLLPLLVAAAVVGDRQLVDPQLALADLAGDLGLDPEVVSRRSSERRTSLRNAL